jgi:hypothetical protein
MTCLSKTTSMPSSLEFLVPGTLVVLTPQLRLDPQDVDSAHPPDANLDSSFAGEIRLTLTKPTRIKTLTVDLVRATFSTCLRRAPFDHD